MKSSRTKTEANAPLMYIVQPDIKQSTRPMQSFFSSNAKKDQQEEVPGETVSKKPETKEEPNFSIISSVKEEEFEKEEPKKPHKMFQEMSIKEKASFLVQFPKHMSQPICDVMTKEKTYRGTIIEVNPEKLSIITPPQKEPVSVPLQAVTQIAIIKI
ncbi:CotO family spore coat protein [Bacillus songklensis]|uniref:CotO family spore coat protein n=1 Tax=Bacillus songklensis TaxID=1069116 RepID=A0ABV8B2H9_9BACI